MHMLVKCFAAACCLLAPSCVSLRFGGAQRSQIHASQHRLLSHAQQEQEAVPEMTRLQFAKMDLLTGERAQSGGAGGSSTLQGLVGLNTAWTKLKNGSWQTVPPAIVYSHTGGKSSSTEDEVFDVVVCGGTLGVFYAMALQSKGFKVAIIERGKIVGRSQEWNVSRKEMDALLRLGILTREEIESVVSIEFNPVRVGFKTDTSIPNTGFELYVRDVLNLGIQPDDLIRLVRKKFEQLGGTVLESTALTRIDVYDDQAVLLTTSSSSSGSSNEKSVSARLVIDCMGNASPISKQIRGPKEPDGICVVVGGCARGFRAENNTYSDLIYTDTPITKKQDPDSHLQYFWEAFPTGSGKTDRTTYLFTYMDASKERPSIYDIFEDYWKLLPRYQGRAIEELEFQRILYGMFPTYRDSPIKSGFARVLQVGDASGIQSPLSFGGFGSLTRHLERILGGISDALRDDLLTSDDLSLINAYQPNLSAAWMFQRAMSVRVSASSSPVRDDVVVGTLSNSFSSMERLGEPVIRPFLMDVLQFFPLLKTLALAGFRDPLTPVKILPHVGLPAMLDFFHHFWNMFVYTLLYDYVSPRVLANAQNLSKREAFAAKRTVEAWKFGSGKDFDDHHA